jgi:hypothetical protein
VPLVSKSAEVERKSAYRDYPPLRKSPFQADEHDGQRAAWVTRLYHSQDAVLRLRDRQIEENVRMLAGQQWTVWSDMLGRFVDVAQLMTVEDLRWRQRPVINKLLMWYVLTHARLTENPPVLTFLPASGDRFDAELAEAMDTIFKAKWNTVGMLEVMDRLVAWMIPGGLAYLKSRVDPNRGPLIPFRGPGVVPLLGPNGEPTGVEVYGEEIGYDREGNPVSTAFEDEHGIGYHDPDPAKIHAERKGDIAVDVLTGLEVRGTWGDAVPWHEKPWHIHRSFMTPEAVYDAFGLDVEPTVVGAGDGGPGELQRLMMGAGFFGAAAQSPFSEFAGSESEERYVPVYELWHRPADFPGMRETMDSPGGRLLIVAGDQVARDGARIARLKYTSPIRRFDFVNIPGRPAGSSPQEALNPIQRAFNKLTGQILQHTAACTDPKPLIHASSGIEEGAWTNEPGVGYIVRTEPGVKAVEYVVPPALSRDVFEAQAFLGAQIEALGNLDGAQGAPPTRDASGELIKELRYNSDRPVASTARRAVLELGRLAEDWRALLPLCMDEEEVISHAGEDQVVRTVTVYPKMFEEGAINVIADVESMLPEGRGERQQRVYKLYLDGIFGPPGSPEAVSAFLERARFPHLGRDARPGGIHRITAEQENGRLVRGEPASSIPILDVYDHLVHLDSHEHVMASPEFLKFDPAVQQEFVLHRMDHQRAYAEQMVQQLMQQAATALAADTAAAEASDASRPLPASDPKKLPPGEAKPAAPSGSPSLPKGHD